MFKDNPFLRTLEGLSNPASWLGQIADEQSDLLSVAEDFGFEAELDALALARFRLDPPAFLLSSVKRTHARVQ